MASQATGVKGPEIYQPYVGQTIPPIKRVENQPDIASILAGIQTPSQYVLNYNMPQAQSAPDFSGMFSQIGNMLGQVGPPPNQEQMQSTAAPQKPAPFASPNIANIHNAISSQSGVQGGYVSTPGGKQTWASQPTPYYGYNTAMPVYNPSKDPALSPTPYYGYNTPMSGSQGRIQ